MSINANANVVGTPNGLGGYDYTVTLNNSAASTDSIGTFWFSWIPGEDFLTQIPTSVGAPAGWTPAVVHIGSGYSIEWTANSAINNIPVNGSSSAFTFHSTETPAELAANSPFDSLYPSTTSYVYSGAALASNFQVITPTVGAPAAAESATGTVTPLEVTPGVFQYTISLQDTGTAPIHTFWFAWDDVPDQDFMTQLPTGIGAPTGWTDIVTTHLYPGGGIGYGIEWISTAPGFDLTPTGPGSSSSGFTFTSTETPAEMAGLQQFTDPAFPPPFQTTSSFVYSGTAEATAGGILTLEVACFREGTRIRTPFGDVAVELLHPGDRVITASGESRPVRWTGKRRVVCRGHPHPEQVWPIRVAAGALGVAMPGADLYLSPDHALCLDGVLVPVKYLVTGTTIASVPVDAVTWHHIELDSHDVVLAEGAPAETYLDTGGRAKFESQFALVFPDAGIPGRAQTMREAGSYADLVVTGPVLAAIRHRIAVRASRLTEVSAAEQVA